MAIAAATAGCADRAGVFSSSNESWFTKPIFQKPDWALPDSVSRTADLGPKGPAGANDLVGGDGRCVAGAQMAQAAVPQAPTDREVGSVAGDLAGAPMQAMAPGATDPGVPLVVGGIALGMTECQVAQRAGLPGNVAMNAGDRGQRRVTLTYLSGPWPGIYQFSDGRLREIVRAPAPPEPPKAPPKKKIAKKPVQKPQT